MCYIRAFIQMLFYLLRLSLGPSLFIMCVLVSSWFIWIDVLLNFVNVLCIQGCLYRYGCYYKYWLFLSLYVLFTKVNRQIISIHTYTYTYKLLFRKKYLVIPLTKLLRERHPVYNKALNVDDNLLNMLILRLRELNGLWALDEKVPDWIAGRTNLGNGSGVLCAPDSVLE